MRGGEEPLSSSPSPRGGGAIVSDRGGRLLPCCRDVFFLGPVAVVVDDGVELSMMMTLAGVAAGFALSTDLLREHRAAGE